MSFSGASAFLCGDSRFEDCIKESKSSNACERFSSFKFGGTSKSSNHDIGESGFKTALSSFAANDSVRENNSGFSSKSSAFERSDEKPVKTSGFAVFDEKASGFGSKTKMSSGNNVNTFATGDAKSVFEKKLPDEKPSGSFPKKSTFAISGGFGEEAERSRGSFNCENEGNRANECSEKQKPRFPGTSDLRGYFNCGEEGRRREECTHPPMEDKPRASTFMPAEIDDCELYKMRITQGVRFDEFYYADVMVTADGKQINVNPLCSFADLKLSPTVAANVRKAGYSKPTPIQQYAIPIIAAKMDLMACAQTGSGKTAAFLLPIIKELMENSDFAVSGTLPIEPRCIIVAPTRELAEQINIEGRKFTAGTMLRVSTVYGGTHVMYSKSRLEAGASIIVATMGRLLHFVKENVISLREVRYVVLDEADRMLCAESFAESVREMMEYMPPREKRNVLLFSATFPEAVQTLAQEHLRKNYAMLAVDKIGSANPCITQEIIEIQDHATKKDKLLTLLGLDLKKYKVIDESIYEQKTLVFVNSKKLADWLGIVLSEANLPSVTIHGDRLQQQRHEAISQFKSGQKAVLIATAVAERGLDIRGVDHVINYDLPSCRDNYVHRIGRTGRVGNPGRATSFFDPRADAELASALVSILSDAQQVVPDFLKSYDAYGTAPTNSKTSVFNEDNDIW